MPADNAVNEQIIVDTSADDNETALKISNSRFYSNDIRNLSTRPFIRALNGKIIMKIHFLTTTHLLLQHQLVQLSLYMKVLLIGERSLFIILSLKILVFQMADFSKAR